MLPPLTTNAWLRFDAIRRALSTTGAHSVIEIGAGEGALATWLSGKVEYLGVEHDDTSRQLAQARLGRAGHGGRIVAGLDDAGVARFDMVCAFEVLEHIDDDVAALAEWRMHLSAGGHVLLSVPAHGNRFGPADELAGHYRRYDGDELRARLDKAGFSMVRLTSHGAGLGQVLERGRNQLARRRALAATLEQRTAASGRLFQPHSPVAAAACAALALPFRALQAPFASGDFGTGYVALARMSP